EGPEADVVVFPGDGRKVLVDDGGVRTRRADAAGEGRVDAGVLTATEVANGPARVDPVHVAGLEARVGHEICLRRRGRNRSGQENYSQENEAPFHCHEPPNTQIYEFV